MSSTASPPPIEAETKQDNHPNVNPCFCCEMPYREFFEFINVSDIFGSILGLLIMLIFFIVGFGISILMLVLTVCFLIVAIAAFCLYGSCKSYRTAFHKCYAVLRCFLSVLDLIFMIIILDLVLFKELPEWADDLRPLLIVLVVLLLFLTVLNLYWSYLLGIVVFSNQADSPTQSLVDEDGEREITVSGEAQDPSQRRESITVM